MGQPARRPTITSVRNAARVLSQAAMAEAAQIRKDQGHNGHQAAQELEHLAHSVGSLASRIEALRYG